jgi:hypothetical protein
MSISSAIDANNPDVVYRGKFYPDLIPFGHPPAQQGLGSVLQVNSSAFIPNTTTKQDATDFDTLGCVKIETGTVGQGNNLALVIGEAGDTLQIKGATTKGSLLVGNGANTEEFAIPVAPAPVPPNGSVLILDSTQPLGVRWGGESGPIATISAGNNIDILGTSANPIVQLQSPLTTELNMGFVAIRDAVASTGTAGQVLSSSGTGATVWASLPSPPPPPPPVSTWTAYTPDFSSTLTLGDGNVSAYYANIGKLTFVYVDIGWGSTTAFGPVINPLGLLVSIPSFSLQVDISWNTLVDGENVLNGTQIALDGSATFTEDTASNGGLYGQVIYVAQGGPAGTRGRSNYVKLSPYYLSGNYLVAPPIPGVDATTPFTWGANSRITAFFNYPTK